MQCRGVKFAWRLRAPAQRASHQKLVSPWDVDDDFLDGIDVIAPGFTNVDGRLPPPPGFMTTAYAPETCPDNMHGIVVVTCETTNRLPSSGLPGGQGSADEAVDLLGRGPHVRELGYELLPIGVGGEAAVFRQSRPSQRRWREENLEVAG